MFWQKIFFAVSLIIALDVFINSFTRITGLDRIHYTNNLTTNKFFDAFTCIISFFVFVLAVLCLFNK